VPESSKPRKKPAYVAPPEAKVVKGNPRWLVPTMLGLMVLGLLWIVVTYISQTAYPIPGIGNANLLVGFAMLFSGLFLATRWH
jgi:hypothetical protein